MSLDHHPIPLEALPPGWGPADNDDGYVAYRRPRPGIELIASRTEADRSHPSLGLGCYWELRYRLPVGEVSVTDTIGHVSTRSAALEGLLQCMHRVHERVEEPDPVAVEAVLEDVSLGSAVPDGAAGLE